jgi:serine protease Do
VTPSRHAVRTLLPTLLLLASAVVVVVVVYWGRREMEFQRTRLSVDEAADRLADPMGPGAVLASLSLAQRDLAAFVQPSVVHIESIRRARSNDDATFSTGSGWIWDDAGHVVTAWHVVRDAEKIDVQLHDGSRRRGKIMAFDPLTDIAVISIEPARTIAATRSVAGGVQQGDLVFAFGSPLDFRFSVTGGVVSGLGRDVAGATGNRGQAYENFIQIDAPINPGSSGGPVTDHLGHVIGMSTAIASDPLSSHTNDRFTGVALAISLDMINSIVPQLLDDGRVRRGYLGVAILDTDQPAQSMLGMVNGLGGAIVTSINPDSALAKAGLQPGDILWQVGETRVTVDTLSDLLAAGNTAVHASHIFGDDPFDPRVLNCSTEAADIVATSLDTPLYKLLEPSDAPAAGVLITTPTLGGPADKAGLRRGDIIVSINGRPTRSVDQLRAIISTCIPDTAIGVRVWRPDGALASGRFLEISATLSDRLSQ